MLIRKNAANGIDTKEFRSLNKTPTTVPTVLIRSGPPALRNR